MQTYLSSGLTKISINFTQPPDAENKDFPFGIRLLIKTRELNLQPDEKIEQILINDIKQNRFILEDEENLSLMDFPPNRDNLLALLTST